VIPLGQTLYLPQSMIMALVLICSTVLVAYLAAPARSVKTAEWFGVAEPEEASPENAGPATKGEWLEYFPLLSLIIGVIGFVYLARLLAARGPLAALDLRSLHSLFLMAGFLLPWWPRSSPPALA